MADISFSVSRGTLIDTLAAGSQTVTEGTATPGAGDLEVRILGTANWTKNEIEHAMDTIFRYLVNANNSTSIPL
jgi:hypothetical protein